MKNNSKGLILAAIFALGAISILTIFASQSSLALNQGIFWLIGTVILFITSQFYYKNWQKLSLQFYLATIAALFLVFIVGDSVRGSTRWIDLGFFRFQPSEITKVSTIVLLATLFERRPAEKIQNLILSIIVISPAFILIFLEPDIGSAMAIAAIWAAQAFAAGIKKQHITALLVLFVAAGILFYELLAPYQKDRIQTFINPSHDPLGAGYNIIQSKIATGSGMVFGRGLGRGSQSQLNFLPENESDFIFASIAEQLGFLGAGAVVGLFTLFLTRVANLAKEADRFGRLIIAGALGMFGYQFLVNVGMNMAIIPVTGITLPFVSYGGSSLISSLFLLGIIFAAKRERY